MGGDLLKQQSLLIRDYFYSNSNRTFCEQTMGTLIKPRSAASELGLRYLSMFYKKEARLIWVKQAGFHCTFAESGLKKLIREF